NCDNRDPGIIYFVRDTGRGIAPDEIDYVFKRFYQTEHSKTGYHEGTGLGLTIVKEYLNLMGGDIWVKSHPGTGSTFFFTL
ncbi:MAG: ATP-binding protein, partial [Bacteroidales bacterium]|nr:ATP-binding protein [Bacteroidales bacterium]